MTWTGPDGQQQHCAAVETSSTEVDAATVQQLANIAASAAAGTGLRTDGTERRSAQASTALPEVCARLFGVDTPPASQ